MKATASPCNAITRHREAASALSRGDPEKDSDYPHK